MIKKNKFFSIYKKKIIILSLSLIYYFHNFHILQKKFFYKNKIGINQKTESKVCICTLGKNENLYIREFIEHYKKYGVKKINLYDNNDINGEKFEEIIDDYIKNGFVQLYNWRGRKYVQISIMNECYKNNKDIYDWIMFSDIDEYIHLHDNYTKINIFLDEHRYRKCQIIYLNLICHSDNGHLHYENKPVKERFPNVSQKAKLGKIKLEVKSIIRGHMENITMNCIHRGNTNLKNCNGFGHVNTTDFIFTKEPDIEYYYYDHYYSKSTEEFIQKVQRGDALFNMGFKLNRINKYFEESELTLEKILMIENSTGLNLSQYKAKLDSLLFNKSK